MDVEQWLRDLIHSDTTNAAAGKAGITPPTLFRQVKRNTISGRNVILLCRACGRSPVSGLIEAGYITAEEAYEADPEYALRHATPEQPVAEIHRRLTGTSHCDTAVDD